jgi:protease PrsW
MSMIISFLTRYPFILSFLLGLIPAFIWLKFWLREDIHPEPPKMITLSFLGGMLSVLFVLPLQRIVYSFIPEPNAWSFLIWAAIEEIFKFLLVYIIALRNKVTDEPVDDIIYLIISALGFVTFENTLFLISPIHSGDFAGAFITGNLRFVGASLVHIISSGTIGISLGLAFYKSRSSKVLHLLSGFLAAITLHTAFNLFIINQLEGNLFYIFGGVWIGIIVLLLLFEKVKTIHASAASLERL